MKTTIEITIEDLNKILEKELGFEKIWFNSAKPIFGGKIMITGEKCVLQEKNESYINNEHLKNKEDP